jgi:hypothetical protein
MTLVALGLAMFLAAEPPPASRDMALSVAFIGNMAFVISDGATTIVTDFPYESGAFGYQSWKPADLPPTPGEVFALFTHRHADHFDPALLAARGWKTYGPEDLRKQVEASRWARLEELERRKIRVRPMETPHAKVEHYSYLIDWQGLRIYVSGDTEDPSSLISAGDVDLALVTSWILEAAKGRQKARRVLVAHVPPAGKVEALPPGAAVAVPGAVLSLSSAGLGGPETP